MAIIPQFGFLYGSTLRKNIDPLKENSDQEIKRLIGDFYQKNENLKTNLIDLDFGIDEGGENLSNGEK